MFDLTVLNNSNLARTLGVFLVILIWLFFFRVIRAVWVEVRPRRSGARRPFLPMPVRRPLTPVAREGEHVLFCGLPNPKESGAGPTTSPKRSLLAGLLAAGFGSTTPTPRASTHVSTGATARYGSRTSAPRTVRG